MLRVLLIGLLACSRDAPRSTEIDSRAPVRVIFATPTGDASVTVEVAASPTTIERGLMDRDELSIEHGMLFLMRYERDWAFWMQNTLIPLDMIFITKQHTVAGIIHDATPLSANRRRVGIPSLYVLEVNGGWASRHGVSAGSTVRFDNLQL